MFEKETKLDPKKKLQLARELGLEPRQVAIWFQNKRARWKSKHLDRDYNLLSSNYNTLVSQFESLKKEKQSLLLQLQKLNDFIDKTQKEGHDHECCGHEEASGGQGSSIGPAASIDHNDGGSANKFNMKSSSTTEFEEYVKPPSLSSLDRSEYGVGVLSDDESSRNLDYLGLDEEPELLMNVVEPASLEFDGLLDQPSTSYQWWNFWSGM